MDSNDADAAPSIAFSEEEKLPEVIDESSSWFSKNLEDESDSTAEHEVLDTQINQDDLGVELDSVKESDLIEEEVEKSEEQMMETDSQSELLDDISDNSAAEEHQITLEPKKDELTELKDIAIDTKKHDISSELKEMFEEKSSDAEELPESSLAKHSLDTEITKEDKLKDIVPDDILGKDDSFDELDNETLHQELGSHLTYEKSKDLISDLPDTNPDLHDDELVPQPEDVVTEENPPELETEVDIEKSLDEINFEEKSTLLDLAENIGTKEIDEIMDQEMPSVEDSSSKDISADLKDISSDIQESCVSELKDDLEIHLDDVKVDSEELLKTGQDGVGLDEEIISQVDKSSIELNQENMMVEFAHDDGNQVLIQINTEQCDVPAEESPKTDGLVMETSDGQTLVFSTETMETDSAETDLVSQVEGGAEFLQAVTGKLEDVLVPVKEEQKKEEDPVPKPEAEQVEPAEQVELAAEPQPPAPTIIKKEPVQDESPKCCITTCKSGKSSLRTTYRYFKPPVNKILFKKWEYIFNQAKQQISPTSLICELHFRTGLIYKRGVDRTGKVVWALREGALPKLSPPGVLRVSGVVPTVSTTVQVTKKAEGSTKSPVVKSAPLAEAKSPVRNPSATPKVVLGKKILQRPVKTVATKVTNEVTDIGFLYKNPELVKAAQDEMVSQDVLVCGECHSVFHILELFQAHKMARNCKGESNFKGNPSEPKPQVWAFLLWKSAQAKVSDVDSSWRLYQRWCKMDDRIRSVWISAGKSLQEGNAIASLKLVETAPTKFERGRVGRPPKEKDTDEEDLPVRKVKKPKFQPAIKSTPVLEPDLGGAGDASTFSEPEPMEVENSHVSSAKPNEDAYDVDKTLEDLARHTPELITSEVEIKQEVMSDEDHGENKENDDFRPGKETDEVQNCSRCKKEITNPRGGILCAAGCYGYFHVECTRVANIKKLLKMGVKKLAWKCDVCKLQPTTSQIKTQPVLVKINPEKLIKDGLEKDEEEFVVEKIVSRRYNIKKKHFEYLLKWEGYPSEQNTWEPAENLGTCQHLLKAFEEALAKQQAAKQAVINKQAPAPKPEPAYKIKPPIMPKKKIEPSIPGPSTPLVNSMGRPVRSSKQKAMDQVKVWCGSIVKPSEDDNSMKRKASSDSDFDDDVVVKRVKVELESDDSDMEPVRRVEKVTPRGRGRPPGSTNAAKLAAQQAAANRPVVNGQRESSLAAALGLESDDDDDRGLGSSPSTPQKSSIVRKMSTLSPHNQQVLVASAKGVVTVDPKQVPNLTSGVYIMSNKTGIVKVDNDKTLSTLQKSGVLKKPLTGPSNSEMSPKGPSGVVVLPRAEATANQQKVGVMRKVPNSPVSSPGTPTLAAAAPASNVPGRPSGLLKPLRPAVTPRPLGLLKSQTPSSTEPPKPSSPSSPVTSPNRPLGIPPGVNTKIQQLVKPRAFTPLRGRPVASPLVKRATVESPNLQATPQQKLLIARKKAESENSDAGTAVKPTMSISSLKKLPTSLPTATEEVKSPLLKPKLEPGTPALPPIKSTNKALAHPLLSRGRGRGAFRARGRGNSLGQLLQVNQREREAAEVVKESKLVDSDNLLMEFQEPSDSEESDDGLDDIFPNLAELPPIEPDSPPRPMSLCPLTGKVLCKAEGEKTPEPTPPPSPKAPTPPPPPPPPVEEPTHILPDHEDEIETEAVEPPTPVAVTAISPRPGPTTAVIKQDGMICKVEMSPGGTTGTLVEAITAPTTASHSVTEGTVTIKKPLASRNRLNRGPQLSVMPTNSSSSSLGTITVPARKLFQEENGDDDMVTITGEDGLVYQVSNSELTGNTLLVSSGEDGQQQCVYVTTDGDGTEEGSTILTLDTAYADAVAQLGTDQVNILSTENGDQFYIKEGDDDGQLMTLEGEEGMVGDDQSGQVVAQLVEAGEPAPGGSRRVVLLLPDGNLMMTEVDEEQYAALDLDK